MQTIADRLAAPPELDEPFEPKPLAGAPGMRTVRMGVIYLK